MATTFAASIVQSSLDYANALSYGSLALNIASFGVLKTLFLMLLYLIITFQSVADFLSSLAGGRQADTI